MIVIENDTDYCRVDSLKDFKELATVLSGLQNSSPSRKLFGSCQLADTLMKQIGFKLGKVDKFGA